MPDKPRLFISVDVEEWFNSTKLVSIGDDSRYKAESDIVETVETLLACFAQARLVGTFFFLTDIAKRYPDLVRRVAAGGHELALHGETHEHLSNVGNDDFSAMLDRSKDYFQREFATALRGYRAPYFSINSGKLALLKRAGFAYDSSVVPSLPIPGWYGSWRAPLTPYFIGDRLDSAEPKGRFVEFPLSVHPNLRIPGLGGYYFRNLGLHWTQHILSRCLERLGYAILYIHPWELSPRVPALPDMPFYMRRRTGEWTRSALSRLLTQARDSFDFENTTLWDFCRLRPTPAAQNPL